MDALGKFYTSTVIVTVNVEGKLNGITVAWVTRVSWQPPMVAVSIGKTRYTRELLDKTDSFAICVLGKEAKDIAEYFGTVSGRNVDKFKKFPYTMSEGNLPIPEGTIAYLECEKSGSFEAGDHIVYIGNIRRQKVLKDEKPLIFGEHTLMILK
ncbi:flavin reductase family protein [Thermotoga sp. KOL6]|uniref:flavin reductase family protein n=1 Tax=Thermotoga sp. KOL6 TaxID=126741 RepID=UPI000C7687AB|nr:flavin reductase family protein [Thermotoga sp. KOL6]PLV58746.1 flavin oxidoreductase [Thermotoga sp. KOL6]